MLPLAGASVPKIVIDSAAERGGLGSLWFGAVSVLRKNRCCHKYCFLPFFRMPREHNQARRTPPVPHAGSLCASSGALPKPRFRHSRDCDYLRIRLLIRRYRSHRTNSFLRFGSLRAALIFWFVECIVYKPICRVWLWLQC